VIGSAGRPEGAARPEKTDCTARCQPGSGTAKAVITSRAVARRIVADIGDQRPHRRLRLLARRPLIDRHGRRVHMVDQLGGALLDSGVHCLSNRAAQRPGSRPPARTSIPPRLRLYSRLVGGDNKPSPSRANLRFCHAQRSLQSPHHRAGRDDSGSAGCTTPMPAPRHIQNSAARPSPSI